MTGVVPSGDVTIFVNGVAGSSFVNFQGYNGSMLTFSEPFVSSGTSIRYLVDYVTDIGCPSLTASILRGCQDMYVNDTYTVLFQGVNLCGDWCRGIISGPQSYSQTSPYSYLCGCDSTGGNQAIIDIDCGIPPCSCMGGLETVYGFYFNNTYGFYGGNYLGTVTMDQTGSGSCQWLGQSDDMTFWASSRRHAYSLQTVVDSKSQFTSDDYQRVYDINGPSPLMGTQAYYTDTSEITYWASCAPCLYSDYTSGIELLGGVEIVPALSSVVVLLSPYPDQLYAPSPCGNCNLFNATLHFNLDSISWTQFNGGGGTTNINQSIPITISGGSYDATLRTIYWANYNLNIPVVTIPCAGGNATLEVFVGGVSMGAYLCSFGATIYFYSVYTINGVSTKSGITPFVTANSNIIANAGKYQLCGGTIPINADCPLVLSSCNPLELDANLTLFSGPIGSQEGCAAIYFTGAVFSITE